jgi:hypothetical protein
MNSIVTQHFISCHNQLKKNNIVRSSRQFALSLDYLPQSLSEILKGRRDVTIELLRKAIELYKMNPHYLFTGEGTPFMESKSSKELKVLTVVQTPKNKVQIIHVPIPAQAAYPENTSNPIFIKELPTLSLPDYKYNIGNHRSFDVTGDSMESTLFEGDKVICSYLDPIHWHEGIKDNYVYVFVTQSDILIRRVESQDKDLETIYAKADNTAYQKMEIKLINLKEIWYVRAKFSPFLPSPKSIKNLMRNELQNLNQAICKQTQVIEMLQEVITSNLKK